MAAMLTVDRQHRLKPSTSQTRMNTRFVESVDSMGGVFEVHAHVGQ